MKFSYVKADGGEQVLETEVITEASNESVVVRAPEFESGIEQEAGEGEVCAKVKIASLHGVPEFKSSTCMTRVGPMKTKLPCVLTRNSNKVIYASLCYPKDAEAKLADAAKSCALGAAGAASIAAFVASPAAALPAFEAAFKACLTAKVGSLASKVRVGLHSESEHGDWKRRV